MSSLKASAKAHEEAAAALEAQLQEAQNAAGNAAADRRRLEAKLQQHAEVHLWKIADDLTPQCFLSRIAEPLEELIFSSTDAPTRLGRRPQQRRSAFLRRAPRWTPPRRLQR